MNFNYDIDEDTCTNSYNFDLWNTYYVKRINEGAIIYRCRTTGGNGKFSSTIKNIINL